MLKKFFTSKPKKTKYSFSALDLGYPSWIRFRKSFYVEVNEKGQVVNSGNPLWSEAPKESTSHIPTRNLQFYIQQSSVC